jgi:hypothetical protein
MHGPCTQLHRAYQSRRRVRILVGLLLGALASPSTSAATLQELFNGASIDAGNARFSNWQLKSLDATATAPNLAMINVTPLVTDPATPGLSFAAGSQIATTGLNAIDLSFSYRVQAIGASASFVSDALAMTGLTFGGPSGFANITQDANTIAGTALGTAVAFANRQDNVFQFNATANHDARHAMNVNVNIFLQGIATTDTISLTAFTQRYSQTGPTPLVGDFNNDRRVDGADFLLWQRGGSPVPRSASDLALWRSHFGESVAVTAALARVPEPAAATLLMVAATGALALTRRARRSIAR